MRMPPLPLPPLPPLVQWMQATRLRQALEGCRGAVALVEILKKSALLSLYVVYGVGAHFENVY